MNKFEIFLHKSEELRNGYIKSMELPDKDFEHKWQECFSYIPVFFDEIYKVCNGTKDDISEQKFFDFLPGYRLMQLDEVIENHKQNNKDNIKEDLEYDLIIPFLTDYAGSYYLYAIKDNKEHILLYTDGIFEKMHSSIDDFWNTIIAFYEEKVYFLDEDGFLSYDFDKEGEIGKKYNKDILYWE